MAKPMPPNTRQSGPEAHTAPKEPRDVGMKPGGPIMPSKQGYENPGPTPNLRGVEPNTAMHRGTPNPEQQGSDIRHGDHNPGMDNGNHFGHGVPMPIVHPMGRHSDVSKKIDPKQVTPGHFARHDGEVRG